MLFLLLLVQFAFFNKWKDEIGPVDDILEQKWKELEELANGDNWHPTHPVKYIMKGHMDVYTRLPDENSKFQAVKATTVVKGKTPTEVIDWISTKRTKPNLRKMVDTHLLFVESHLIDPPHKIVTHVGFDLNSKLLNNRNYLFLEDVKHEEQRSVIYGGSLDEDQMSDWVKWETKRQWFVRGKMHVFGFIAENHPDGTMLTHIAHADPLGGQYPFQHNKVWKEYVSGVLRRYAEHWVRLERNWISEPTDEL